MSTLSKSKAQGRFDWDAPEAQGHETVGASQLLDEASYATVVEYWRGIRETTKSPR